MPLLADARSANSQKHELGVVVHPPLQFLEAFRRGKLGGFGFLDHEQRSSGERE